MPLFALVHELDWSVELQRTQHLWHQRGEFYFHIKLVNFTQKETLFSDHRLRTLYWGESTKLPILSMGLWCQIPLILFLKYLLFIYLWLCWVFVSVWGGLSLVVASRGHCSSRCAGLSLSRPLLLRSTGSRRTGSVVVAHGPSCSAACGIFPDQGLNPCSLHWQADSQPLRHQGSMPLHPNACHWS